jgi:hypothetical protein
MDNVIHLYSSCLYFCYFRFNTQNSELRFSNFTFGPLVMRLLHVNNKPNLAYELYMDKVIFGDFVYHECLSLL